ncbi:PREDICTED: uncharacterized protein LOC106553544 [Thamnophis sirtalis]|uniref:Uncharacterized protein LOC106553544 n=1 Tax=Thamnophis sirtalis TaxID=35019 RepID=A0A6I9YU29_9SAUR|nr:PREDICTED: uncharacterized protein LOC106553544 [Thamnophis sirtalis]
MKRKVVSQELPDLFSAGIHSWQCKIGCQLSKDGHKQGHFQCGYDGENFISLDQKTLTWTAVDVRAQVIKKRWEEEPFFTQNINNFLEQECIQLLQKGLFYGKDSLLRKEPPLVKVSRRIQYNSMETLVCQIYGFYPKEIDATWKKDEEVWEQDTYRGGVLPNSDRTYHIWLSIEVDPKERDRYRCYVDHAGLPEPLILAWVEPALVPHMGLVAGVVGVVVAIIFIAVGVTVYVSKYLLGGHKVNKDFLLLPNITLGFHMYGHFQKENIIYLNSLSMLSSQGQKVPGYKCDSKDTLLSVIGDLSAKFSRLMASIFSIFKIPQLGVGFEFSQGERRVYPSFFRINPKESPQYVGLVQLLLYFQWNWVGLLAPEDDRGERFVSTLTPMLQEKEICLAFTLMLKSDNLPIARKTFTRNFPILFKTEVFILFADTIIVSSVIVAFYFFENIRKVSFKKVCIFASHWKLGLGDSEDTLKIIKLYNGVLHFRGHSGDVSEFHHFLLPLDPLNPQGDVFLPQWWEFVFDCKIHKSGKIPPNGEKQCTGKENLQNLPNYTIEKRMTGESYNIYNAVYALAHALCAISGSRVGSSMMKLGTRISNVQSWQEGSPISKNYQQILALVFTVREINKDLVLLPNITLGFHICDNRQIEREISFISLSLLSTRGQEVPGYKCDRQDTLLSVVGGLNSKSSRQMASIFSLFKVPQWNWVGLLAPEDDNGECFISTLMPMLQEKEICLAFIERLKSNYFATTMWNVLHSSKTWSEAEVIILFGDSSSIINVVTTMKIREDWTKTPFSKVWVLTSHWKVSRGESKDTLKGLNPFHGALHFRDHSRDVSEFSHFLLSLDPFNPQGDIFLPKWWEFVFGCKIYKPGEFDFPQQKPCTGKENLHNLPTLVFETSLTGESYNIYNAIYALVHALYALCVSGGQLAMMKLGKKISNVQPWQVIFVTFYPVHSSLERKLPI